MTIKWRDTFVDVVYDLAKRYNQAPSEADRHWIFDIARYAWMEATFWDGLDRYDPQPRPTFDDFMTLWDRAIEGASGDVQ